MLNFSYLRHPPELYHLEPKVNEATGTNSLGKRTRRLFHKVPYTAFENEKISEFRDYASSKGIALDCEDNQILRYLYTGDFNFEEALDKIRIYLEWEHDPQIQTLGYEGRSILNTGFIFTFGRDIKKRPIVYLNVAKTDFQRFTITDYYSAINAVLNCVVEFCFVQGVIENYLFVIDMQGKNFTSLPIESIGSIIKKLAIVYSMYLGNLLVINAPTFVKFTYTAVKIFIHEDTRQKIQILETKELNRFKEFVDEDQLYEMHGGIIKNPAEYWPPQVPSLPTAHLLEETMYYSVDENPTLFLDQEMLSFPEDGNNNCCQAECTIF